MPCGSCAFMLCTNLGICDFAHVPYPCSIVCNTFGTLTPSYPIVILVVNHCHTAHPSIYCCQICNFPRIICHPAPPILAQPCGCSNPLLLVVPLAQKVSRKIWRFNWANVSSKLTYAGWADNSQHRAHAKISTHNSSLGV